MFLFTKPKQGTGLKYKGQGGAYDIIYWDSNYNPEWFKETGYTMSGHCPLNTIYKINKW